MTKTYAIAILMNVAALLYNIAIFDVQHDLGLMSFMIGVNVTVIAGLLLVWQATK